MHATPNGGPLEGYRVLELTTNIAGPFCGRLLADFGAETIMIEAARGDDVRSYGKRYKGKSLYGGSILRNKANISLDPRTPEGQEIVKKLVAKSDILVENLRPGSMEKWNLGYDVLSKINPKLVMVRISGYGQTGPNSKLTGYGVNCEAFSGLRYIIGYPDRPPPRVAMPLTDYISGLYAALGALMAVLESQRTGRGQVVDAALYECAFSFMEQFVPAYDKLGEIAQRVGSALPSVVPNNLYPTKDNKDILIAASAQALYHKLTKVMGREDLFTDPRFRTMVDRAANQQELDRIIAAWTSQYTQAELKNMLDEVGVPCTPIYTMADIFQDPHYKARNMLIEVEDEDIGPVKQVNVVPKLTRTPGKVKWAGRRTGQDTLRVLTELVGLSVAEVERLEAAGVVYCDRSGAGKAS
jgi:crotonobetainyl-CoA:carnitine CoA-transferase CaiB-like acyl-CoA transferase